MIILGLLAVVTISLWAVITLAAMIARKNTQAAPPNKRRCGLSAPPLEGGGARGAQWARPALHREHGDDDHDLRRQNAQEHRYWVNRSVT